MHDRLAHANVLPERDLLVEAEIVDDKGLPLDDLEPFVVLEGRDVVGLDVGELDLAGAQRRYGCGRVLEVAVDQPVDLRARRRGSRRSATNSTYWSLTYCLNLNGPVPIGLVAHQVLVASSFGVMPDKRMLRQDHELGQVSRGGPHRGARA